MQLRLSVMIVRSFPSDYLIMNNVDRFVCTQEMQKYMYKKPQSFHSRYIRSIYFDVFE